MTISVTIKVNDGVVLASDSATTISDGKGQIHNVYNNANKLFNLVKVYPIGVATWGNGSFGQASIATLAKDFRARITPAFDSKKYEIETITKEFANFLYEEHWIPAYGKHQEKPYTGFVVAGYSAANADAEVWQIDIGQKDQPELQITRKDQPGNVLVTWAGQPEAIFRIVKGHIPELSQVLKVSGVDDKVCKDIMQRLAAYEQSLISPPMPIQDAIDVAEFLVQLTCGYVRFIPGAPIVGGPIELAAITKHEGFKWIRRKHFYTAEFNQPTTGE